MKTIKNRISNRYLHSLYLKTSEALTANGAKTYSRSGSPLLDFFAQAGAMRNNPYVAVDLFAKAFAFDRLLAVKILFYLRDIRGGQGERKVFRLCLSWLEVYHKDIFAKVIDLVPEYGRWDDLFIDSTVCFELISKQLKSDLDSDVPSLLAKWLPTMNASSQATRLAAREMSLKLGLSEIEYRKAVRDCRKKIKTVEELMSAKAWKEINYSGVPSQASLRYRTAFYRNDESRYTEFIEDAISNKVRVNSTTLYPHQIYNAVLKDYSPALEAMWNQLPDYTNNTNALVVADTSSSMTMGNGLPMAVSVSLALYFAERTTGIFKNSFITFSMNPKLQYVEADTLKGKMDGISKAEWEMNTDLQKVFELLLDVAVENKINETEMPSTIYVLSDMEFDRASAGRTNFEDIEIRYVKAGYKRPTLVFWNVNASGMNLPVKDEEKNVTMISGFSPSVFKYVFEGKSPVESMLEVINSKRYNKINF